MFFQRPTWAMKRCSILDKYTERKTSAGRRKRTISSRREFQYFALTDNRYPLIACYFPFERQLSNTSHHSMWKGMKSVSEIGVRSSVNFCLRQFVPLESGPHGLSTWISQLVSIWAKTTSEIVRQWLTPVFAPWRLVAVSAKCNRVPNNFMMLFFPLCISFCHKWVRVIWIRRVCNALSSLKL